MAVEISYRDRIKLFAKEQSLEKFENKNILFPDRMSMYSWYEFNRKKILNSKDEYCIIISKQKEDYTNHKVKSIPLNQDVISYVDEIKIIEDRELREKLSAESSFYAQFSDYTIDKINKVINESLSKEHQNIILKAHDGNFHNPLRKDVLTNSELNLYRKAKARVNNILSGKIKASSPKRSNPKRPKSFYDLFNNADKEIIDSLFNELTDIRKEVVLKRHDGSLDNIQNFDIKLTKNESSTYIEAMKYIEDKLKEEPEVKIKPVNYDENIAYLKLHELLQTKHFTDTLMKLDPEHAMVILIKLKNPTKSAKEISDFTNVPYERVIKILSEGLDIIIRSLDELFNTVFTDYKDIKNEIKINKKDK